MCPTSSVPAHCALVLCCPLITRIIADQTAWLETTACVIVLAYVIGLNADVICSCVYFLCDASFCFHTTDVEEKQNPEASSQQIVEQTIG